jgi:uncharacterized protein (TIGR00299 family) protein
MILSVVFSGESNMRIVRFDSVGGASGDMILGALAAIGADLDRVAADLHALIPENIEISCDSAASHGLHGTRAQVRIPGAAATPQARPDWPDAAHTPHAHPHTHPHLHAAHSHTHAPQHAHAHRQLREIEAILAAPALPAQTRRLALAVFRRLAEAEAEIHGKTPETVHFHEVGATDAIVDVAGSCLALEQLGVTAVTLGPLPCGTGTITCAHGVMPNPAPATMRLLAGLATVPTDEPFELVTPTGAAILATWAELLGNCTIPARVVRTGFGFGQRALRGRPNALRATLLETTETDPPSVAGASADALCVIETNLDDCNPQWIGDLISRLLEAGARDAWATPVTMKKSRPGFVLSVLAAPAEVPELQRLIFMGTTTFGLRSHAVTRTTLERRFETVRTPWGEVSVKIGSSAGRDIVRTPEFEDCARLARAAGLMPRQVHEAALHG